MKVNIKITTETDINTEFSFNLNNIDYNILTCSLVQLKSTMNNETLTYTERKELCEHYVKEIGKEINNATLIVEGIKK